MRLCELRDKDVINTCNCKRLGCVVDLEIDMCKGCIEAIIVPGPGRICGFLGNESVYIIPYECIKRVGPDIILVDICEEKFLKK
ncbi:PRC-barrel domain-containing protein [Lachnospiraceae bacterium LCP25S3_G4]